MTDNLLGQQLDEYRLDALLGQGGMARVYRGLDVRLKRWVAIKVIDTPFRTDSDHLIRFEREAQAIAQLEHPHIIRLYRYGEANSLLYMAMQYIEGTTLDSVLANYQRAGTFIEPEKASRVVREICLALDYAHHKGVIHRDVKPANILLDRDGRAILTDFGLALLADVGTQGEIFGTPHYMAPEQAISSAGAVPQSDLYALGVILYEMFTGELPFDAASPLDVAMLHMSEPPRPPRELRPEISLKLEAVILKALNKEPEQRYPSGTTLAEALDQALQAGPVKKSPAVASGSRPSSLEPVVPAVAERPLPPLPAGVGLPAPQQIKSQFRPAPPASFSGPTASSDPATPSAGKRPLIYAGLGFILAGGLVLIVLLASLFLWLPGKNGAQEMSAGRPPTADVSLTVLGNEAIEELESSNGSLTKETQTETPTSTSTSLPAESSTFVSSLAVTDTSTVTPVTPSSTPSPTLMPTVQPTDTPIPTNIPTARPTDTAIPTNTPTLQPTATPIPTNTPTIRPTDIPVPTNTPAATPTALPAITPTPTSPRPIADTQSQFSGSQGGQNWRYQWSLGRESFNWTDMQYDGACWRTTNSESFVRICQSSAHPGETGDIAWRWTSPVTGPIYVWLSAAKIDTGGGDGVKVIVYRGLELIKSWQLNGTDGTGFTEGLTMDIAEGDFLFFVMKIGGGSNNDETFFRAQIYR